MAESVAGSVEPLWQVAHRELLGLAHARAGLDVEEARWLVIARRSNTHVRLGMGSFVEYRPGASPDDAAEDGARRQVIRLEVSGDVLATWREAVAKIRRDSDGPLDDEQVLLLMARQVLGGPADEGRASYQVAMTVCEQCRGAWQRGVR